MSEFIREAIEDMTGGRETWRVRLILILPAAAIAATYALARLS